jgi:NAD(P)-dependent dehydrogenase (short-subunit alcohol dehydrogenase family)
VSDLGASTEKVAIVTGGASGLGAAIAARLEQDNHRVAVADIAPTDPTHESVDVTRDAEVKGLVNATVERYGRLDVLVCSAAVETRSKLVDCTDEDWQRVLDVNLKGPFLCMRHAIPAMAASGGGSIVLMSSILGAIGSPDYAAYCASKGALNNLAKQAAVESAPDNVRVNVVAPSATDTGLFMQMIAKAPNPDAIVAMVAGRTPMKRLGTAAEVADTVAFLCSPGAGYISGAIIAVDGGMAARRIV